ncbi:MAG: cell division protein ZipA C-terminal FtsZ-binding domain-containing protein [Burkholderiales bacterium]|jgi:FtsZ-interacting cell division protein ZipA|nr:cell division protein ZipA C-terminal FtsZ-binding domain-containing protein [Burkholderiales bacterium]
MTPLRWVLLAVGVAVIAAVMAYNAWQERAWRRRTAQAFDRPDVDALLSPRPASGLEPASGPEPASALRTSVAQTVDAPAVAPAPEAETAPIDAEAILERGDGFDAGRTQQVLTAAGALARGGHVDAWDPARGRWRAADAVDAAGAQRLRVTMPLADRRGAAGRSELEGFAVVVAGVADATGAALDMPSVEAMEAQARALDALCNEVDVAIGISVIAGDGATFAADRIATIADAQGLVLAPDGRFLARAADGQRVDFTLDNQGSEGFFADQLAQLRSPGVTLLLDVPRAPGALASYDRMVDVARALADALGGRLVDDNRRPLTEAGLAATRDAVTKIYATMAAAGIAPGGATAMRLFAG